MSGQAEKILEVARSWLGYLEKKRGTYTDEQLKNKTYAAGSDNYTIFGKWCGLQGQPWCAMGLSYFADSAGISTEIFPKFADCDVGMAWFKKRGRFVEAGRASPSPTAGDVVFFGAPGDAQHVGIVDWVEDGRVFTIEGNTSSGAGFVANGGAVMGKDYPLTYNRILGYGRPDYVAADAALPVPSGTLNKTQPANAGLEDKIVSDIEFEKMMDIWLAKRGRLPAADNLAPADFEAAIAAGLTDGTRPQAPASRQEVAVMAYRAMRKARE
jgi:hypothetical protein